MTVGENINDYMREEARAAARHDRFGMRRVGDRMWEDHELPDLRDLLQRQVNKPTMYALIFVGAALAAIFSPAVALASGLGFLVSESVDFAVFSLTAPRLGEMWGVAVSNAVSIVVDSVIFLAVAFGSLAFVEGQVIGKAIATLAALVALAALPRRAVTA